MEKQKEYREGDQEGTEKESGVSDTYYDSRTGEKVPAITTLLLVLTPNGVEMLTNIKGIKSSRQATLHDIVAMAAAASAEAQAKINSRYSAEVMLQTLQRAQQAAMEAQRMPGGLPVIGQGGTRKPH